MAIGLMVYRGFYFRAFDSSGILQSGFWFIGEFVIGVLVYRGFSYRAFDSSGFCYRATGHRAFGYRPYVVLPNSVLFGTSKSNISRLQRVQNSLARVVTRSRRNDRITPILKRLHWLPISYRIQFKIATLTFKCAKLATLNISNQLSPTDCLQERCVHLTNIFCINLQSRPKLQRELSVKLLHPFRILSR